MYGRANFNLRATAGWRKGGASPLRRVRNHEGEMAPLIGFREVWECDSDAGSMTEVFQWSSWWWGCCPPLTGSQVRYLELAATGNRPTRTWLILPLRSLITQQHRPLQPIFSFVTASQDEGRRVRRLEPAPFASLAVQTEMAPG